MKIFVIMPFEDDLDRVYEEFVRDPLAEKGYDVSRADDISADQNIPRSIVRGIYEADLIVADITRQNPNVYYELGIAHVLRKPCLHIVQDFDDLAFDIRSYSAIKYSTFLSDAEILTKEILDKINRESGNEYKFSNPVDDYIGLQCLCVDYSGDILLPQVSESDGKVSADHSYEDEPELSEDGEMGILDAIALAFDGMNDVNEIVQGANAEMTELGEKMQRHTATSERLNAEPNQGGAIRKRLILARRVASDMNHFSENVKDAAPKLHESWTKLDQGLGHYLSSYDIKNDEELESTRTLIDSMTEMNGSNANAREALESLSLTFVNNRGLSRDVDRALRSSEKTLSDLIDEFKYGESIMKRVIELGSDMIDRYSAN